MQDQTYHDFDMVPEASSKYQEFDNTSESTGQDELLAPSDDILRKEDSSGPDSQENIDGRVFVGIPAVYRDYGPSLEERLFGEDGAGRECVARVPTAPGDIGQNPEYDIFEHKIISRGDNPYLPTYIPAFSSNISLLRTSSTDDEYGLFNVSSNESKSLSSGCDESEHDDIGSSTLPTSMRDDPPDTDDEDMSKNVWEFQAQGDQLLYIGGSKGQTTDDHHVDIKTQNDSIDPNGANVEPSSDITKTLATFDGLFGRDPNLPTPAETPRHACTTQPDPTTSLYAHVTGSSIYLWNLGSTITFNVDRDSFLSIPDELYATKCLKKAADRWNRGLEGVQFKEAAHNGPAVFQLRYIQGPGDPNHLATAFFPGAVPGARVLKVYEASFNKINGNYDFLANVFCHELGHILGLRHEFAYREKRPATQFSRYNRLSIMEYPDDLGQMDIQQSDYDGVRSLYDGRKAWLRGYRIKHVSPV